MVSSASIKNRGLKKNHKQTYMELLHERGPKETLQVYLPLQQALLVHLCTHKSKQRFQEQRVIALRPR